MKLITRIITLMLSISLCFCLLVPAFAADVPTYTSSDAVLDLIERYEGFSATVYYDGGVGYIGFGSNYTAAKNYFGYAVTSITKEQARALTRSQLGSIENTLNNFLKKNSITVNQNQFDALMDLTYNIGVGWTAYKNSDGTGCQLKELLLKGSSAWTDSAVRSAFGCWTKAGGVVLKGLVKRRNEETDLFMKDAAPAFEDAQEITGYSDVSGSAWYYSYVTDATDSGLMSGYGNGCFGPEDQLTRAQAVKILANLSGVNLSGYTTSAYSDVSSGDWYYSCIAWATAKGIINGTGNGRFSPEEPVTRQDLCTIFARYLKSCGKTAGAAATTFTDDSQIADYAKESVYYCNALGIVNGTDGGRFAPNGYASRAEAAAMLMRMHSVLG